MPIPSTRLLFLRLNGVFIIAFFLAGCASRLDSRLSYVGERQLGVASPAFLRSMQALGHSDFTDGNRVDLLQNGGTIFPAMLQAIAHARRSIDFENYIFWPDALGRRFIDALTARARAGVRVRLLLDGFGSRKMSPYFIDRLRAAGCRVAWFRPLLLHTLERADYRTHRRILVIDGRLGFTGSVGIAAIWNGHAQDPDHWRDTQVRIRGPAVGRLQAVFAEDWQEATGQVLVGERYYPRLAPAGTLRAQVVSSSPWKTGVPTLRMVMDVAILAARHSIYITNSYFLPDQQMLNHLIAARERGVDVRILVPGAWTDVDFLQPLSRASYGPLLKAGVKIYEYQPTMMHSKTMVVDGLWSTVGSSNFDNRSFSLNNEANLCIYDPAFAARMEKVFFQDLAKSRRIRYADWLRRSPWERFKAMLVAPIGAEL